MSKLEDLPSYMDKITEKVESLEKDINTQLETLNKFDEKKLQAININITKRRLSNTLYNLRNIRGELESESERLKKVLSP